MPPLSPHPVDDRKLGPVAQPLRVSFSFYSVDATAHVAANLGDAALDPPQLAAAVGVSLHRLQELFHGRGRDIPDDIWERRLAAAAKRLADPTCAHLSVGMLAYGCGFASQAHFSRRFMERYGMPPRGYRMTSLLSEAGSRPDL